MRASGRTTRAIDNAIQWLFTHPGEELMVIDHYSTREANEYMFRNIGRRMAIEHQHAFRNLIVDKNRLTITLKPKEQRE